MAPAPGSSTWLAPTATALRSLGPLLVGLVLALALMQLAAPAMKEFHVKVLTDIGINVILAVSLTLVNGFTGQFSLGHAAFMMIGGYSSVALTYYGSFALWGSAGVHGGFLGSGEWLFLAGCLLGALVAAAFGYLVGLPSLRLRGDYLAIVTLGFGEIVRILFQQTREVKYTAESVARASQADLLLSLGGALGFTSIPKYTNLFWAFAFVTVILLVAYRIKYSTHGLAFLSVREDEIAAEAMGVPAPRYKVRAFVLAAFFAGIAGALFAHEVGTALNPRELGFQKSIEIVIMVVLGGMGSISGAVLAAAIVTILPEWLRQPTHVWPLGLIAVAAVLLLSRGRKRRLAAVLAGVTLLLEILTDQARRRGVDLAQYRMIFYSLSLVGMMILRPQGLFGIHEIWEIEPLAGWLALLRPARRHKLTAGVPAPTPPGRPIPAAHADAPLLAVDAVSLSFGGLKAVSEFNLRLGRGELHGLIGPNGAGKTTVFNLLTGIYPPDRGTVRLSGRELNGLTPFQIAAAGIARTFQNTRLFPDLTVLDNVRVACHLRVRHTLGAAVLRTSGHLTEERATVDRAMELLEVFQLAERAGERAANLPYGDRRRLEMARAIATEPEILLLDEPAAGLNTQEKAGLRGLIHSVRERFGPTVLLIEHDMGVVMGLCERVTVLDHGQIIAVGTPAEVQSDPKVIEAYLGMPMPSVPGQEP